MLHACDQTEVHDFACILLEAAALTNLPRDKILRLIDYCLGAGGVVSVYVVNDFVICVTVETT